MNRPEGSDVKRTASQSRQDPGIVHIQPGQLARAIEVLTLAFQHYPIMPHFFARQAEERYLASSRAFFEFLCQGRLAMGDPILGIQTDAGVLAGVAVLESPEKRLTPGGTVRSAAVRGSLWRLVLKGGLPAFWRIYRYSEEAARAQPARAHYYLTSIGILPAHQRNGLGRRLIEHIHAVAANDPRAVGIRLETSLAANVPIWEKFGYDVVRQYSSGEIITWCMFQSFE